VREVVALGVEEVLLGAGGSYAGGFIPYDETLDPATAEATTVALSVITPDVGGQLNVGHPQASEALLAHAAAVGADVRRAVADVRVTAGDAPEVSWRAGEGPNLARCRLVVGADGRASTVRRQLGIALEERPAEVFGAGLLVRTADGLAGANAFGTEGENCFLAFPREGDVTRLYLMVDIGRQPEFTGSGRTDRFLSSYRATCFPGSEAYASAEVVGPCGGAPMTDSWTLGPPAVPGAVLIGDSAGWNDPLIGQGLSIAFRDARMVSDVLLEGSDWSVGAFAGWVHERRERMHRLFVAAHVATRLRCDFSEIGRRRRRKALDAMFTEPAVLAQVACTLMGPEAFPAEAFSDEAVAATLAIC
jgi:2-polyprenyl-6-methoxyphenol hydroxylase-like FAD-dependent oxidoreductase